MEYAPWLLDDEATLTEFMGLASIVCLCSSMGIEDNSQI
jgi:hypothetical protein